MKKLLVVLGVVAFGFAFTACKKECKCKLGPLNWNIPSETTVDTKEKCDEIKELYKDLGMITCDWK